MTQTFYSIHDHYISHHSVKGQKWGIRRYQNPDGTLTELGKKRYTNKSGEFSTMRDAGKDVARSLAGLGASMAGAYVMRGNPIGILTSLGVQLGLDVVSAIKQVKRNRVRANAEKAGIVSEARAMDDRLASSVVSGLGAGPAGAIVAGVVAVVRNSAAHARRNASAETVASSAKAITQTKVSDIKKRVS